MQLSQDDIGEFKAIYHEEYGVTLTDAQALGLATAALNLMRAIYRPLPDKTCPSENGTLP